MKRSNQPTDDKPVISASEVNRFLYCPYQWFYTRTYGDKELRARYRELHPDAGENQAFARGRAFHERYAGRELRKRIVFYVFICAIVILVVLLSYYFYRIWE